MNASYDWLREFVDITLSAQEVAELVTARCATVDEVIPLRADLADLVVGKVVEAGHHPDSDHLWLTKVDAGTGQLIDVVCGAPNVRAGASYPFAPVGATLPGGLKMERRKIRGAYSNGMLCSARELGLGDEHSGILELTAPPAPGTPLLRAMPVGDTRIVVDVFPNRPDLLSQLGIAREIAAATGPPLREWDPAGSINVELPSIVRGVASASRDGVGVSVADPVDCPRYIGAVIRGVRVEPSPPWLRARLEAVGARSINNVVDVTNLMLHGFGQPMHAFDLATLGGSEVMVRRARAGEAIRTLDGIDRTLDPDTIVIADAERAQAIAGVIGGAGSEVRESTTDIFLEVATFSQQRVRATRRKLNVSTDASYRFERGVSPGELDRLSRLALRAIVAVAGGRVSAWLDVHATLPHPLTVTVRPERVALVLGEAVSADEITRLLEPIGFSVAPSGPERLHVIVPVWRRDVTEEVDLIEEVARLRGYDTFSSELRPFRAGRMADAPLEEISQRLRETLVGLGFLETRPMPFVAGGPDYGLRVANPLAENEAYLRRSVLESLSLRAEHNLAHMRRSIRLFEIGAVFHPRDLDASGSSAPSPYALEEARVEDPGATDARMAARRFVPPAARDLPVEEVHVGVLLLGARRPAHFTEPEPPASDAWDAKYVAQTIVTSVIGGAAVQFEPGGEAGTLWRVRCGEREVGRVVSLQLDAPVWASASFGIELDVGALMLERSRMPALTYKPLPTTPAVEIDLALLVPDAVAAERVEAVIRQSAGELLERLELFDEFRGSGVPGGMRSLAWRLTFRHSERTLRDKEIEGRRERLLRTLDQELGVRQRTS